MAHLPSRIHLLAGVFVFCIAFPCLLTAQSSNPCEDTQSQKDWDSATSPVYADAIQLAHTLSDHGIAVNCIRRSKEEAMFEGQKGAAWFQTSQGVFEAWFLPRTESFAKLEVVATPQANGGYLYTFKGTPQVGTKLDSPKQLSFIKHGNVMVKVWGNQQLADNLSKALQ